MLQYYNYLKRVLTLITQSSVFEIYLQRKPSLVDTNGTHHFVQYIQ